MRRRVIAITSGKGGVGKTQLAANLAVTLARAGRRVCLLDADLGLANVDVVLGLAPLASLRDVLRGERRLAEVVVEGPAGVRVIPSANGTAEPPTMTPDEQGRLLLELGALGGADEVLLIDTAAGVAADVLFFASVADDVLVVLTPEPTALTDAYALMKALAVRHGRREFLILVNMAVGAAEAEATFRRLARVAERFLGVRLAYQGYVPQDAAAPAAIRTQRPMVIAAPGAPASLAIDALARRLVQTEGRV
jgi:flagellar biosynthesis protein FlhG